MITIAITVGVFIGFFLLGYIAGIWYTKHVKKVVDEPIKKAESEKRSQVEFTQPNLTDEKLLLTLMEREHCN